MLGGKRCLGKSKRDSSSFWPAFQSAIEAEVSAIRLVHPQRVKAIAAAKLKNDRVDSATLAHLLRCNLLPEPWRADRGTRERRKRVRLRISLGQHRAALILMWRVWPWRASC